MYAMLRYCCRWDNVVLWFAKCWVLAGAMLLHGSYNVDFFKWCATMTEYFSVLHNFDNYIRHRAILPTTCNVAGISFRPTLYSHTGYMPL